MISRTQEFLEDGTVSVLTRVLGLAWRLVLHHPQQALGEEMSDPMGGGLWTAARGVQQVSSRWTAELPVGHQLSTCLPCVPAPSQLLRATRLLLANGLQVEVTQVEDLEPVHAPLVLSAPVASH